MLEYDKIRPASAAASAAAAAAGTGGLSRPPLVLSRGGGGGGRTTGLMGEDERPDKEAAWVLDGWGDEPSVVRGIIIEDST